MRSSILLVGLMIGLYSSAQSPEENLRNLKIELPKAGAPVASNEHCGGGGDGC